LFHSIVKEQVIPGQLEVQRANANTTEAQALSQAIWKEKSTAQKINFARTTVFIFNSLSVG